MAIIDLYSKRQKRLRGEVLDIFTYDVLPNTLKVQIVHIIKDCFGYNDHDFREDLPSDIYQHIRDILRREYGVFELRTTTSLYGGEAKDELLDFFLETDDVEKALDVIELACKVIEKIILPKHHDFRHLYHSKIHPDQAIQDLNIRFKENGIGYSYESGHIIRIDSTYTHSEITKPTLNLLNRGKFKGANEEYLKAHEHYKNGRNKECLTECLKAFESTLKIICQEKGWSFAPNITAKGLIQICFDNGLIPTFTQNQFTSLRSLLESGIPTLRNNLGGHGQGKIPQKVDDEMTRYALNLTGTNIIFLVEQS
ncbi:STM4504/CBY_0614 family protein [Sphingobacterium wenxiniae]|uniref:Abortive infection C-terminus n=1 Tax=Sphingobacterium wenxiniae TaxID=683125 RepID=A0A1I6THA8_9SPHI|nr:hypothetical protein [Sphingobacterium wenxiniae]SFS88612.1 hypothetical protein SAMN05660206_106152 [Sphingobacterium wenxiniae]